MQVPVSVGRPIMKCELLPYTSIRQVLVDLVISPPFLQLRLSVDVDTDGYIVRCVCIYVYVYVFVYVIGVS